MMLVRFRYALESAIGGSLKGLAGQMNNTGAIAAAGRIAPSTGDGGETSVFGDRGGATFAEGTTKGATATKEEGQKDIVKSKSKEAERSSCVERMQQRSRRSKQRQAHGETLHEMGEEDAD